MRSPQSREIDSARSNSLAVVDVIIPAFNAAQTLRVALDSVIAQTFEDWRILLVDDGSKDDTPALVAPYQERLGERLKYIRQENAGLPAARNTAIRHATAELLALLDADDVWLPQRLEKTVARFDGRPELGLVYGFVSRIDPGGEVIDTFARANKHGEGRVAPYIYMRMLDLPCPTVSFRRSCVEQVGLFDETLRATEDRDLWVRIAQRYEVALIPEVLAYYRVSPQAMTTNPERMLQAQLRFVEKHYGSPGCGWRARRVALSWMYRQRAEALVARGQMRAAAWSALKAFAFYPLQASNARTAASVLLRWVGWRRGSDVGIAR